jgi:hypothetical protein
MMPEEAPAVQNWRLLIVACVLGLVVMVVYNVHINKIKRGMDKVMITAYRYDRNMESGEKVAEDDLISVQLAQDTAEDIGRLLKEHEKGLAVNQIIQSDVSKDGFVMMGHFTASASTGIGNELHPDKVYETILIDSKKSVGKVLRIGNYVNILGMLPTKQGTYKTYRIIEKLKVVAIGGNTDSGGKRGSAGRGVRSFGTITVEMKVKDPDVSLQWSNLQTYLRGSPFIEICSPRVTVRGGAGTIAQDLIHYTTKAASAGGAGEGYGGGDY